MKIRIIIISLLLFLLSEIAAVTILAPDNPASLPLLIAAEDIPDLEVKLFSSHKQAHSLFLSRKVPLLVTGYAVGEGFARRDVPIKMLASWVSGMNYLVSADSTVRSFKDLQNEKVYFPFKGSPIEKMSLWLAEQEKNSSDIVFRTGYLPFNSMIALMEKSEIKHAVMPISSALRIVDEQNFFLAFNLDDQWQQITGSDFYPQLALFCAPAFTDKVEDMQLLRELEKAVDFINSNAISTYRSYSKKLSYPQENIISSLQLMKFRLLTGSSLQDKMETYFEKTGIEKPPKSFYAAD